MPPFGTLGLRGETGVSVPGYSGGSSLQQELKGISETWQETGPRSHHKAQKFSVRQQQTESCGIINRKRNFY